MDLQNHKFQKDYETAFSIKIFPFLFFNGVISITYNAFLKPKTDIKEELDNLRNQLIPLSIMQSVSSMANKITAYLLFKYQKKKYFRYIENHRNRNDMPEGEMDQVSSLVDTLKVENQSVTRVVMNLRTKESTLFNQVDMDTIEINSFKKELAAMDITTSYSLSITKYSYIIIFSCIYPVGALVLLVMNMIELRIFIFALTHCFQRPLCVRVIGIGGFQSYWNSITYASVFTNVWLMSEYQFLDIEVDGESLITDKIKLFVLAGIIFFIFFVKALLQYFISDTPAWVRIAFKKIQVKKNMNSKKMEIDETLV